VATNDWPDGAVLTLTVERWNEENQVYEETYTETATNIGEYSFDQGHGSDPPDPFFVERGDRVTVTDGTTTKVHDVYALFVDGIDYDTNEVFGTTDATDREVCVNLWSAPGQPQRCTDVFGTDGEWKVDFDSTIGEDITPQSDLAAWQYDDDGDATTMNNHAVPEVAYEFIGFGDPVDNEAVNVVTAGRTVPLKFRITTGAGDPVTDLADVSVIVTTLQCELGTTADHVEEYAAGNSGLQNLGDGYYQYNWKTSKTYKNSCKLLTLDIGDGVLHTAQFHFTR